MLFTPMTCKAMEIAYNAHQGQKDKSGMPYIYHPARVAEGFTNEAEACVAWLHDVVEDSGTTIDDLRLEGFGEVVCTAVKVLTHKKNTPYKDYIQAISRNQIAKAVKMADLRDNMDTTRVLGEFDEGFERRMAKYHRAYRYLSGDETAFDTTDGK